MNPATLRFPLHVTAYHRAIVSPFYAAMQNKRVVIDFSVKRPGLISLNRQLQPLQDFANRQACVKVKAVGGFHEGYWGLLRQYTFNNLRKLLPAGNRRQQFEIR